MLDLLTTEKEFISKHIEVGGTAVDFTMGNGHDTLWLAKAVGESGRVYAFDIQQQALDSTAKLLESENVHNVTLIKSSHHLVKDYVEGPICVGMFNLGWLPGGDKSVTTLHETTLPAIAAATELLAHGGGLLIAVYPGHPEGEVEGKMVTEMLSGYSRFQYTVSCLKIINSPSSPFFFLVEKK